MTGAGFRIRRTNVPEADVQGFFRQIGEAESRGLELEVVGTVTRGLGLRGGYAWTNSEILATRVVLQAASCRMPRATRQNCGCAIGLRKADWRR